MTIVYDDTAQRWIDDGSGPESTPAPTKPASAEPTESSEITSLLGILSPYTEADFSTAQLMELNRLQKDFPRVQSFWKDRTNQETGESETPPMSQDPYALASYWGHINRRDRAMGYDIDPRNLFKTTRPSSSRNLAQQISSGFRNFGVDPLSRALGIEPREVGEIAAKYWPVILSVVAAPAIAGTVGVGGNLAATGAIAGATQGGIGALSANGDFGDIIGSAIKGGAIGGAAGGVGQFAGGMLDPGLGRQLATGATRAGTAAVLSGSDREALLNAVLMGALSGVDSFDRNIDPELGQVATDWEDAMIAEQGMLGAGPALFSPTSYMMQPGFLGAESPEAALATTFSPVMSDLAEGVTYLPGQLAAMSAEPQPATLPDTQPTEPPDSGITAREALGYAKNAKKIFDLYKQITGATGDVPEFEYLSREEWQEGQEGQGGQSDEDYFTYIGEAALEYLDLSPEAMREAGFNPPTP